MEIQNELRKLPGVGRLLELAQVQEFLRAHGHDLVVETIRQVFDDTRWAIRSGSPCPSDEHLMDAVAAALEASLEPTLRRVINATGVIIHTNLGRSPLSEAARDAMAAAGIGYSNLEYDLVAGQRGSRYVHAEALLCRLTGAEAALVVNNNAGAVLLTLSALARGREVIISRSQLIEIGGGFRIPDVMAQSGARLVEVGTTNRTRIDDYKEAITAETGLVMRAHHSNFQIVGFTEEPTLEELVELGSRHGLPVLDDLGSGTLIDTAPFGLDHEPTVQESLAAGASLVSFSGDKLLGATQAGIIVGSRDLMDRLRRFAMTRALRVDKVTLAGLQATLLHYLQGEAVAAIPTWRMIARPVDELREIATRWAVDLQGRGLPVTVVPGESTVGGGSLPGARLPTWHVALDVPSPDEMMKRLRMQRPAIVAIIKDDRLLVDPRTVQPGEEDTLLGGLHAAHRQDV